MLNPKTRTHNDPPADSLAGQQIPPQGAPAAQLQQDVVPAGQSPHLQAADDVGVLGAEGGTDGARTPTGEIRTV